MQELQRTLYTFLQVITIHDLSHVFISPKCKAYLDPVMQLLLYSSCNHKDIIVRKVCVMFAIYFTRGLHFTRLVLVFLTKSNSLNVSFIFTI